MEDSKEAERKLFDQASSPYRLSPSRFRGDDSCNISERELCPDTSDDSILLASVAWSDKRETRGHLALRNVASACKRCVTQHRLGLSILLVLLFLFVVAVGPSRTRSTTVLWGKHGTDLGVVATDHVLPPQTSTVCSPALSDTFSAVKNLSASTLAPGLSQETASHNSTKTCSDPWARPGYIWYGKEAHDVRWVPYSYMNRPVADPDFALNYNPEDFTYPNAPNELDANVLARLPIEYSKAFQSQTGRRNDNRLEFMRNKHIMLLGSSLDQNFVRSFCMMHEHEHPGNNPWVTPNEHINYCQFPDYNFTLSAVRHFGMHQSPWFSIKKYPEEKHFLFEERIDSAVGPLADKLGQPDLLVLGTGLWDFKYLHELRQMHDPDSSAWVHEQLSPQRAAWMLSRITQAVTLLRERFPDTFLLYRTTTRLNAVRGLDDEEMVSIFQLNEGARAVMRSLGVPILNWADLVEGNHEYRDHMHFKDESRPYWLCSEMLLQHLQQLSDPEQDTSCWLDSR